MSQYIRWSRIPTNSNGLYAHHSVLAHEIGIRCPVCLHRGCDIKLIPCGHIFHWDCYNPCDPNYMIHCPLCQCQVTNWFDKKGANWIMNT